MDDEPVKVYARIDEKGLVTGIEGGYTMQNINDLSAWILIDEGYGDRYNLAQSLYLPKPLTTEEGQLRYKYAEGRIVERSDEEIKETTPAEPVFKSIESRVEMLEKQGQEIDISLEALITGRTE